MQSFEIDGIEFVIDTRPGNQRGVSQGNRFVLVKSDQCLDFYRHWQGERPRDILEVGLFQGGSLVLLDKLFGPRKLVGIDIRREPIAALEEYRADKPHIDVHYATSQDNPETRQVARRSFADGIDLVIDDASHLYEQTKATFTMLFPLVRAGGRYVIEDWAWSLRPAYQTESGPWHNRPALTNLVIELLLLVGKSHSVSRIDVLRDLVCIHRGPGVPPADAFENASVLRGRQLGRI
jgi:hypothetical protein